MYRCQRRSQRGIRGICSNRSDDSWNIRFCLNYNLDLHIQADIFFVVDLRIIIVIKIWLKSTKVYKQNYGTLYLLWPWFRSVKFIPSFFPTRVMKLWRNRWDTTDIRRFLFFHSIHFPFWRTKTELCGNFQHFFSDAA